MVWEIDCCRTLRTLKERIANHEILGQDDASLSNSEMVGRRREKEIEEIFHCNAINDGLAA
jgi:hypothetical protein